jgi:hypothetical protein
MKAKAQASSFLPTASGNRFKGYPVATVAFYGPTGDVATKVAVGIVGAADEDPDPLKRWVCSDGDVRQDEKVKAEVSQFIRDQKVKSVAMMDEIIGCPHEEGIDYPEGVSCPQCPYWAGRDRFTRERIQ